MSAVARILVLDDGLLVLTATREALTAGGHEVTCVEEPPAFFKALEAEKPALALVDVSMPTLEGDAVVWIARAHQLQTCLIVLYSAKSAAELAPLAHSSGADGYICKTADEDSLRKQVDDFLKRPSSRPHAAPG